MSLQYTHLSQEASWVYTDAVCCMCCSLLQCVAVCCSITTCRRRPLVCINRARERDCLYYIIVQSYDAGLHSRRHLIKLDICTRPFAYMSQAASCMYNAGSRINFRMTFPDSLFEKWVQERDFKFCFTWYPNDITLCLWSGFIYPRIRTFDRNTFSRSFFQKEAFEIRFMDSDSWVEAEVNFLRREKLCRRD